MKKCKSFIAAATMSLALTVSSAWAMPLPLGTDISDRFHGTVHRNDLIATDETYNLPQTNVISFEAGSYSGWHVHGAMTVIGIAGTGLYQEWGKEAVLIRPGDMVNIPAGVPHFHGAAKDAPFQQFVIYDSTWKALEGHAAHTGALTEEQYEEANENAAPSAMQNNDSEFFVWRWDDGADNAQFQLCGIPQKDSGYAECRKFARVGLCCLFGRNVQPLAQSQNGAGAHCDRRHRLSSDQGRCVGGSASGGCGFLSAQCCSLARCISHKQIRPHRDQSAG